MKKNREFCAVVQRPEQLDFQLFEERTTRRTSPQQATDTGPGREETRP